MIFLQQNLGVSVVLGPFVDWRDGKTLLTATPTLTDLSCTVYKNGTPSALDLTDRLTVDSSGMGTLALSSAQVDTVGTLVVLIANAVVDGFSTDVILPVDASYMVLSSTEYVSFLTGDSYHELLPDASLLTAEQRAGLDQLWAFGEAITYQPGVGTPAVVCAVVSRQGPAELMGLPAGRAERLMITVLNTASGGLIEIGFLPVSTKSARDVSER
jgi:hypothetical protein